MFTGETEGRGGGGFPRLTMFHPINQARTGPRHLPLGKCIRELMSTMRRDQSLCLIDGVQKCGCKVAEGEVGSERGVSPPASRVMRKRASS